MEKGVKIILILVTIVFVWTCSKPNLNGVADGVVGTMQNISSDVSQSMKGGYTPEETRGCQSETLTFEQLHLPTKALTNIHIDPKGFSLYTEEHAYLDFDDPTWYVVNLETRSVKFYTKTWKGWDNGLDVKLPPIENEDLIDKNLLSKNKIKLDIKNPFILPRKRLGVRLGFNTTFKELDTSIVLSEAEEYATLCAGALNTHYEALLKTEYDFAK